MTLTEYCQEREGYRWTPQDTAFVMATAHTLGAFAVAQIRELERQLTDKPPESLRRFTEREVESALSQAALGASEDEEVTRMLKTQPCHASASRMAYQVAARVGQNRVGAP